MFCLADRQRVGAAARLTPICKPDEDGQLIPQVHHGETGRDFAVVLFKKLKTMSIDDLSLLRECLASKDGKQLDELKEQTTKGKAETSTAEDVTGWLKAQVVKGSGREAELQACIDAQEQDDG